MRHDIGYQQTNDSIEIDSWLFEMHGKNQDWMNVNIGADQFQLQYNTIFILHRYRHCSILLRFSSYRMMRKTIFGKRQRHQTNLPFHHWMINNQKYFNRFVIRWVNKTNMPELTDSQMRRGWVWVKEKKFYMHMYVCIDVKYSGLMATM